MVRGNVNCVIWRTQCLRSTAIMCSELSFLTIVTILCGLHLFGNVESLRFHVLPVPPQCRSPVMKLCCSENIGSIPGARNLEGKFIFIAGVADTKGYGWGIAKQCAAMGAKVSVGTWVPMVNIFEKKLRRGDFDQDRLLDNDGNMFDIAHIYPLDVTYDTNDDIPPNVRSSDRYRGHSLYSIQDVADLIQKEEGKIDGLVHCIANAPDINKPLLETSRKAYLSCMSVSTYSFVSMVSRFAPLMKAGGSIVTLSYLGSHKVMPGYGGGISSAKAALETDMRYLAHEVGRAHGVRVNAISPGPLFSRAGTAIGDKSFVGQMLQKSQQIAPLVEATSAADVGAVVAFLLSPSSRAVTGSVLFCDNGFNIM